MRLFVALELNSKVVMNLTELVRKLIPVAPVRWVHPQNMHVTLKYVGEWPPHRLDRVVRALSEVEASSPINVPLAGLGFFPSALNPRVFWVGAENTPALRQLASGVDAALAPLGVAPEVRPYMPHLTLGRMLESSGLDAMNRVIDELPSRDFGTISPDRFVLFESSGAGESSVYRKLAEFPFAPAPVEPVPFARPQAVGSL